MRELPLFLLTFAGARKARLVLSRDRPPSRRNQRRLCFLPAAVVEADIPAGAAAGRRQVDEVPLQRAEGALAGLGEIRAPANAVR
jgi:hypothetical protein